MSDTVVLEIKYKLNLDTPQPPHKEKIIDTLESLWFVESVKEKTGDAPSN